MTTDSATLLANAQAFRDYRYGLDKVTYPWPLPGVRVPQETGGPLVTNCCCFAEALLVHTFKPEWSYRLHQAFMIMTPDPFGPVHAAMESGMGRPLYPEDYPGAWRLVQGWRGNGRGHTFIVVRTETSDAGAGAGGAENRPVLILESNQAYKIRGVGFRDVGNLRDVIAGGLPTTPPSWTWDRLRKTFPKMRACALDVT